MSQARAGLSLTTQEAIVWCGLDINHQGRENLGENKAKRDRRKLLKRLFKATENNLE